CLSRSIWVNAIPDCIVAFRSAKGRPFAKRKATMVAAGNMADTLTFLMGKYPAVLPTDLRYCPNHMWCRPTDNGLRFGFTAYAVRLMQDVYFLDWLVNAGDSLAAKQQIGHIETSKAVADLFAPLAGTLARFNDEVLKD